MVERLSTDIKWSVEIHCSSDDRSGTSVHRFIVITENFVIFIFWAVSLINQQICNEFWVCLYLPPCLQEVSVFGRF